MLSAFYGIQVGVACLNSQPFVKLKHVLGKTNALSQRPNQGIIVSPITMVLTFIVQVIYS